tara:strand:+ start:408 stop:2057 length:1650 start_codon:yes stop_codon:yes gene_type:complete
MLVAAALEMLGIALIIPTVLTMMGREFSEGFSFLQKIFVYLKVDSPEEKSIIIISSLASVFLAKNIFLAFASWFQLHYVFNVYFKVSKKILLNYLNQQYPFFLTHNSSELIRNILIETNQFIFFVLMQGLLIIAEVIVVVGLVAIMFTVEPTGTAVLSLTGIMAILCFYKISAKYLQKIGNARQEADALRLRALQESFGAIKEIKLHNHEKNSAESFAKLNNVWLNATRQNQFLNNLPRLGIEVAAVFCLLILITTMLLSGAKADEFLPTVALFGAMAFRLMPSFTRIITGLQSLDYALPVLNIVHSELLTIPPKFAHSDEPILFNKEIIFENVSFHYSGAGHPALKNFSTTIRKNDFVGITGASGSGKTTIVDLLIGLLKPISGEIKSDGVNIHKNLKTWSKQIGYVPQSVYLINDTLKNNIAFGVSDNEIDTKKLLKAVKSAQLGAYVKTLPLGLETIVGERGINFSGGQVQRIGIARALYREPKILILDEATSALDKNTSESFLQALQVLRGKCTIIFITHRLNGLKGFDKIINLEEGNEVREKES